MSLHSCSVVATVIKPMKKELGGIICTLLASIVVPMILNKLLGVGLRCRRSGHELRNRTVCSTYLSWSW